MDLRSVANIVGYLLGILALAMLLPAAYELVLGSPNWTSFVVSSSITGFAGITLSLTTRTKRPVFSVRHAFVFTTVAWAAVCLFGALPFVFGDLGLSLGEAVFEATSGITTTGSTVMTGLDLLSPGFLMVIFAPESCMDSKRAVGRFLIVASVRLHLGTTSRYVAMCAQVARGAV